MKFVLFAVLCIAAVASAHTCLLNPLQRTPISNINKVEAPECGLMTGPCGGTSQGMPEIAYQGGETIGLVFQKNLNHWKDSYPQGGFTVAWAPKDDASSWNTLFHVKDTNTTSLSIYTGKATLPAVTQDTQVVFRLEYDVSFGVFYQCADVLITPAN